MFFPWERRTSLLRGRVLRSRPLLAAMAMAAVLLLLGMRVRSQTGERSTRATVMAVRAGVDAWRADHEGRCPPALGVLKDQGYIAREPVDAWGRPLVLTCPGRRNPEGYDLMSYGESGDMRGLERIE